jgi:rubredoxin
MRSVRCDVCGTKALSAASQCPACGHLFEMRDGSGGALPLAHCASCDAYYPAHVHSCRWCGTTLTPEKPRKEGFSPAKWIALAAFIAAVWLGLLARDPGPKLAARLRESAQAKPKSAASDTGDRVTATTSADTLAPPETAASSGGTLLSDAAAPRLSPPHPASAAATSPLPKPRPPTQWVNHVARNWVIVRADAHGAAHIVASVGPNARVQLGESRGSWRRIRSRGIAGWVDVSRASFAAIRSEPRRADRLVSR